MINPTTIIMKPSIANVIAEFRNARQEKRAMPTVLLGAGASITAGIPGTSTIVKNIKHRYAQNPQIKALPDSESDYFKLMGCLNAGERRDLLRGYMQNKDVKVNSTHICLAQMVKQGWVDHVLTVNFDNLFRQACIFENHVPTVYDMSNQRLNNNANLRKGAVIHLHGQYDGDFMLNTRNQFDEAGPRILAILQKACHERALIVVGYSGCDPVFNHILSLGYFERGLFWIGFEDDEPQEHVRKELLNEKDDRGASWVEGFNSDTFFLSLHGGLHLPLPLWLTDPYLSMIERVKMIKMSTFGLAEEEVQSLFKDWIKGSSAGLPEKDILLLRKIMDAYSWITRVTKNGNAPGEKNSGADTKGILNSEQIKAKPTEESEWSRVNSQQDDQRKNLKEKDYITFAEKVAMAQLKWIQGTDLRKRATQFTDSNLLRRAVECYRESLILYSQSSITLNSMGVALFDLATREDDDNILMQALDKFKIAHEKAPRDTNILYNWGITLLELSEKKPSVAIYEEAIQKFNIMLSLDPQEKLALVDLGVAKTKLAKIRHDREMLGEAIRIFRRATEIIAKEDCGPVFNNWAYALLCLSKIVSPEQATIDLTIAKEKALQARDMKQPVYTLACCYALLKDKNNALQYLKIALENKTATVREVLNDGNWIDFFDDEDFGRLIEGYL